MGIHFPIRKEWAKTSIDSASSIVFSNPENILEELSVEKASPQYDFESQKTLLTGIVSKKSVISDSSTQTTGNEKLFLIYSKDTTTMLFNNYLLYNSGQQMFLFSYQFVTDFRGYFKLLQDHVGLLP